MVAKEDEERCTLVKEGRTLIEDPIIFEVIKNSLISAAREMSVALRKAAFSPNIKERRDCSCAIFDAGGKLVAQSKDIPVHLGAMPLSVRACIDDLGGRLKDGTMALLNDPYRGGSHLPDLTLVCPVFIHEKLVGFVANRAHHADVGGASPGSMPGLSLNINEEGIVISPRIVIEERNLLKDRVRDLLEGTRTPYERLGDLSAQMAANNVGRDRLITIMKEHSVARVLETFRGLQQYSRRRMLNALSPYIGKTGTYKDVMESDGAGNFDIPIKVSITITKNGANISFAGTSRQVNGNINCPLASTLSAVYYVFIAVFGKGIPTNEGCWSCLDIEVPNSSLLNPVYPAPVSAGNVETSQRVVDVVLASLYEIVPEMIPANSQGTMNNLTIGGVDPRSNKPFTFYETIGGGAGAGYGIYGTSGVHSHMTNTLNTPIESLESEYPVRVISYSLRENTGGHGRWNGGDGIIREIEILADDCIVSIQSERRKTAPRGLAGGKNGKIGVNKMLYHGEEYILQSKTTVKTLHGATIRIETPGGGGWGVPPNQAD